ncbi:MAG: SDR family oxidoreductase [Pseudomonadales bacterium]|nr:SDR family oxidoreductase [Pseudomonadales bacterium]
MKLQGKVVLITGANSGIGFETAKELVKEGAHVFLACRSQERTAPVVDELNNLSKGKAEFIPLDLGDLDSVKHCAETFKAAGLPLNYLICNAGLAGQKGLTESGFELTFGTCHVGHFLLTKLLIDNLKASAPSRVVVVSSMAHRNAKGIDFDAILKPTSTTTGFPEYAAAKLANILFAKGLSKELEGTSVTTYALHPGVIATEVWRSVPWPLDRIMKFFMKGADEGAKTTLYCTLEPSLAEESGLYYDDCKRVEPAEVANDSALADKLWRHSEEWVKSYLEI